MDKELTIDLIRRWSSPAGTLHIQKGIFMSKLRSPIRYFGGKGRLVGKLLPLAPYHEKYIEVFAGGASLFFAKEPVGTEVMNDVHPGLINLYRVIQNPVTCARLMDLMRSTPYSREEYLFCRDNQIVPSDHVEEARRFVVARQMSFSGAFGSGFSFVVEESRRGMASSTSKWLSLTEEMKRIHNRLKTVIIEQEDFRKIIVKHDSPDSFFYLDPPYVQSTRRAGKYEHEMSDKDHEELVEIILRIDGKALLSGYANDLYLPLEENGWIRLDFPMTCTCPRTQEKENSKRVESVWMSPNCNEYKIALP